jgi:DNA-binding GntR family transcriptional regulator
VVRQDAYERLKKAIVTQEYRPGAIVSISELARDLRISRTPIREALNALERDFLVQVVDMRGVLIRPLSVDEIVQLNQMREVIDGLAARLYVQSQWAHLNTAFMRVKDRSWDVWRRSSEQKEVSGRRLKEHLSILAALKSRNPAKAEAAAREHVANGAIDMFKYMHAPYG